MQSAIPWHTELSRPLTDTERSARRFDEKQWAQAFPHRLVSSQVESIKRELESNENRVHVSGIETKPDV